MVTLYFTLFTKKNVILHSKSMARKQRYYVVWQGKQPGIYTDWDTCKAQVQGVQGAQYKGFDSMAEAEQAIKLP